MKPLQAAVLKIEQDRGPAAWSVREIRRGQARRLIEQGHYIGHMRKSGIYFGLYVGNTLAGAAVFGQPSREGVAKALAGPEDEDKRKLGPHSVIELIRFYTLTGLDGTNVGTWFLKRAVEKLPENYEIVVAYSDPNAGHHGGLYQAASWLYLDRRPGRSYHYEDSDGNKIAKQTPWYYAKRNGKKPLETMAQAERREARDRGWTQVPDEPKYRYAYARSKRARKRLLTMSKPYPKPDHKR